jgi:tRNA(Ile)-lysidine synthetase-like protein
MTNLFDYWFTHPNVWFNATKEDDDFITENFFSEFIPPKDEKSFIHNFKLGIEYIIRYDQVPRHVARSKPELNIDPNEYSLKVLPFAEKFYTLHKYSLDSNEFSFVLLPLRHSKIYEKIFYVIKETLIKIKAKPKDLQFRRFLKATLERMISQIDDSTNINVINPKDNIYEIKDSTNICELGLEVYRPRSIEREIAKDFTKNFKMENLETNQPINLETNKYIISLSGGVDSMVLSYILVKLYGALNVVAVHINYNNRKECENEVDVIKQWTSFLGISLYVRKIQELSRPECMELELRDLYESFTRDLRYMTYVNTATLIGSKKCIVYLGHNHDDCFENILTNIASESHYSNLNGMSHETTQKINDNEIIFRRPMLSIPKSEIFSFANFCQIPHFIDSTPKWSQRGKIRDLIRPQIELWNPKAIESFFALSDTMTELMSILDKSALSYVELIKCDQKLTININSIPERMMFKTIFVKLGLQITQKGLDSFYEKLQFIKSNFVKYNINTKNFYQLNKQTKLSWIKINCDEFVIYF